MNLWMAAVLLGLIFAGVFTLCEIIIGSCLLSQKVDGLVLLIPLKKQQGEPHLRSAVSWLEWQRGVFPGRVAALDFGLEQEEKEKCRVFCKGSGVIWVSKNETKQIESLFAKLTAMDYTE